MLSFNVDILTLFRDRDISCMKSLQIDLSDYETVRLWAENIYKQLESKAMPKDRAFWTAEQLKLLRDWIDEGMAP